MAARVNLRDTKLAESYLLEMVILNNLTLTLVNTLSTIGQLIKLCSVR